MSPHQNTGLLGQSLFTLVSFFTQKVKQRLAKNGHLVIQFVDGRQEYKSKDGPHTFEGAKGAAGSALNPEAARRVAQAWGDALAAVGVGRAQGHLLMDG